MRRSWARVGEGVDQRDGQRVDPAQLRELRADVGVVELADHRAVAGDALVDLDGVLQRGERLRLGPDDPAGEPARHVGAGDLQHLAEALGGDEPDRGALALQDRVGRDGGAVQHLRDVRQRDARRRAHPADAVEHADGLVGRGGGGLGPPGRAGRLLHEQHVGERPADVDAEPISHRSSPRAGGPHHHGAGVVDVGGHDGLGPGRVARPDGGDDLDVVGEAAAQRRLVVGVEVAQHDRGVDGAGQRARHRGLVGERDEAAVELAVERHDRVEVLVGAGRPDGQHRRGQLVERGDVGVGRRGARRAR